MLAYQVGEILLFEPFAPLKKSYRGFPVMGVRDRLENGSIRQLAAKEHVYREDDPKSNVFRVEDGVILLYRMLTDGRRQVVDFAYPGDIIGLGPAREHQFSAQATRHARVKSINASALEEAAVSDPTVALKLYHAVAMELQAARSLLIAIGQRSAVERIATFLLMLHDRANGRGGSAAGLDLPMRRSDIGDLLGLTIETVSRTMTRLKSMGVIAFTRCDRVEIRDLDRLEELAEGN